MQIIMALGPILVFIFGLIAFRKWGVVRDECGKIESSATQLRILNFLSCLMAIAAVAVAIVAQTDGKEHDALSFVLLSAGIIGIQSSTLINDLRNRLDKLETILASGEKPISTSKDNE